MREGTTSRMKAADRPYGEFYEFYSVSPEYFGLTLAQHSQATNIRVPAVFEPRRQASRPL
jgi:hypothetical protein